jgi:hypothetical protein
MLQRRRAVVEQVVIGIQCQDGHDLALAQADGGVKKQDKAM